MIITVTPNPLLDFVLHCPTAPNSGGHRVRKISSTVGGKGINVARMLKTLGKPALAISFSGGPNGEKIRSMLKDQGISARLVPTNSETRLGINVVIDDPKSQTWWIEDGEPLTAAEQPDFLSTLKAELPRGTFLAMSGTLPGNTPSDFYRQVLLSAREFRGEIYLDARGEPLLKALEIGGFFLKHNRDESRETFGLDPFDPRDQQKWIQCLENARIWGAMITDGPRRILLWEPPKVSLFDPPEVREVSAVGSGDATLAGLIYARAQGLSLIEATRWGIAAGAADAGHPGPCEAPFAEIEKLLPLVKTPR